MSAEGPDKTVNGERILWDLTHSRQWTVANTQELDNVAEAWIREHEENNRFDLTRGLPWHVKRDQRVAFLGERIKALFRDEAQFRVGTVNRRIQELVNKLTNGWVLADSRETALRKPRIPSPRTALADARRLTEAPSGVPTGMQHIQLPLVLRLEPADVHRPATDNRSMIDLEQEVETEEEESSDIDLDLTGELTLPELEPDTDEESLLTEHSYTGQYSPSRVAEGDIVDDPRYRTPSDIRMPTIDLVVPADYLSSAVPARTRLPPSPPPRRTARVVQGPDPRGVPAVPAAVLGVPPHGYGRAVPRPINIPPPLPPQRPPAIVPPPPAPGAPIGGPVVGNLAPAAVPVRPDDRGIGSYDARYVIERPKTYSETVPMVPLGPKTPIVPRNARLQIPHRFRAPRSQTVNVLNNRVFSTKWGPLENSFATEALRNGSIELRGNAATISCSKAGKVAKGDIHSITKFIKKRFRLGGVLNGSKMSSQQITHHIIANLPGTFQVSR